MPTSYDTYNTLETFNNLAIAAILLQIAKWIVILGVIGIALYFIIRATCKYQSKQNAAAFDYDYLATRTAEEITKRMIWIEQQKANNQGSSSGAPEQPVNME